MKQLREQPLLTRKTAIYHWHIRANKDRPDIVEAMEKKIEEITNNYLTSRQ